VPAKVSVGADAALDLVLLVVSPESATADIIRRAKWTLGRWDLGVLPVVGSYSRIIHQRGKYVFSCQHAECLRIW
jgi:hypothetical protein